MKLIWPISVIILALSVCGDESEEISQESSENAAGYEGAQVVQIKKARSVLDVLSDSKIDVWSSNESFIDVMIKKENVDSVKALLSEKAVPYTVKISNLGEEILKQNPSRTKMRSFEGSPIDFENYNRLEDIYHYLDYLSLNYPHIATVGVMGFTAQQRPMKYLMISSGIPNAKVVFIDGGIHSREWIAPASVIYILGQLVENRESLPQELLDIDFYVVPVLNPDGYEYTHTNDRMWRKNLSKRGECLGTDLNRNFNIFFGLTGTSGDPCSDIYRGSSPNSELETKAHVKLLLQLGERLKAYITFHCYGQFILIPYAYDYDAFPPDYDEMERVANDASSAMRKIAGRSYTVGNTAELMYPAAGGSDDWVKANTGAKYVYCIELADTGTFGFVLPPREIIRTGAEALEAVKVVATAAYAA